MNIRYCLEMPFDSEGRHATGREVWREAAAPGFYNWFPEYEGDETEDLPVTETSDEYEERLIKYEIMKMEV